jgi:hypothetical protein
MSDLGGHLGLGGRGWIEVVLVVEDRRLERRANFVNRRDSFFR